jgi:hypothetical protein
LVLHKNYVCSSFHLLMEYGTGTGTYQILFILLVCFLAHSPIVHLYLAPFEAGPVHILYNSNNTVNFNFCSTFCFCVPDSLFQSQGYRQSKIYRQRVRPSL